MIYPLSNSEAIELQYLENVKNYPENCSTEVIAFLHGKGWARDERTVPYRLTEKGLERHRFLLEKQNAWKYRMLTPRQRVHLHLLRNIPPTPEMYEEVAYLKDKGFIYGDYRRSKGRDNYGAILDVLVNGPTASGMDYLEQLDQQVTNAHAQQHTATPQPAADNPATTLPKVETKLWHERSSWRAFVFWGLVALVSGLLVWAISASLAKLGV